MDAAFAVALQAHSARGGLRSRPLPAPACDVAPAVGLRCAPSEPLRRRAAVTRAGPGRTHGRPARFFVAAEQAEQPQSPQSAEKQKRKLESMDYKTDRSSGVESQATPEYLKSSTTTTYGITDAEREILKRQRAEASEHVRQAQLLFEYSRYEEAIEACKKALRLVKKNSDIGGEAGLWLGMGLQNVGRTDEAKKVYRILTAHPTAKTRQYAMQLLEVLDAPPVEDQEFPTIPDLSSLEEKWIRYQEGRPLHEEDDRQRRIREAREKEEKFMEDIRNYRRQQFKQNKYFYVGMAGALLILCRLAWLNAHAGM
eukprot:tig00021098_g18179.t1